MLNTRFENIKGVFFDLDGTLIDTAPDFVVTVNQLRAKYNLPALTDKDIRFHVSTGAGGLVEACFETENEESFNQVRQELLDLYFDLNHPESRLFPAADSFLLKLEEAGIPWGIVTNKPEKFAVPLIKRLGLENRLVCLLCPDHVQNKKPHPESLYLAASMAKVDPKDCIYFGDHRRDIEAGKAAGMLTASVEFGYIPPNDTAASWKADYHFDTFEHIYNTIFTQ